MMEYDNKYVIIQWWLYMFVSITLYVYNQFTYSFYKTVIHLPT